MDPVANACTCTYSYPDRQSDGYGNTYKPASNDSACDTFTRLWCTRVEIWGHHRQQCDSQMGVVGDVS